MCMISVIVPVYNVEKYLRRCVDSIINQTYRNLEIILVDDGSPDKSGEICDEYAKQDSRIKVIHKKNGGVSSARNAGITAASGEYIMFVDSDDYIDSGMLSDMVLKIPCDIVCCGQKYLTSNGVIIGSSSMESYEKVDMNTFIGYYYCDAEKLNLISNSWSKLYLKSIIDSNNIKFDNGLSFAEDSLFVMRFLSHAKFISNIPKTYYNNVQYGSGTLMHKYNANSFEICELVYKAKAEFAKSSEVCDIKFLNAKYFNQYIAFLSQIYSRSKMNSSEKYKKLKAAINNDFLHFLIDNNDICGFKNKLIKFAAKTGFILPVHIIYSIRWMF